MAVTHFNHPILRGDPHAKSWSNVGLRAKDLTEHGRLLVMQRLDRLQLGSLASR